MLRHIGFTLIELVIVLVIVGIIVGVIFRPKTTEVIPRTTMMVSGSELAQNLRYARIQALESGLIYKVVFTVPSVNYQIFKQVRGQNQWILDHSAQTAESSVKVVQTSLPTHQIVFDSSGFPFQDPVGDLPLNSLDSPMTVTRNIVFQSDEGWTGTLTVFPASGYVTWNIQGN